MNNINNKCKILEDYVISQAIVPNLLAIDNKIDEFNNQNSYKIKWINKSIPFQHKLIIHPNTTWNYYYSLRAIGNNKFGYFLISGSLLQEKELYIDTLDYFLVTLICCILICAILIPLTKSIPNQLFLKPVNMLLGTLRNAEPDSRKNGEYEQSIELVEISDKLNNLINMIEQKSKDAAMGILAKSIAHNLKSPLLVLQDCKNKLKNFASMDEKLIYDLGIAIDNIKYTLINLLNTNTENKFQNHEDSDKPRYILLKSLMNEIINQKTIEWHGQCALIYTDNTNNDDNIWIQTLHFSFTNVISNLLNNGFESFKPDVKGIIELNLYKTHDYTILNIKDNGSGIEKNILQKVINGYSTKSSGQGIGLSTSIKYFKELGGELNIVSTDSGQGTSIDLKIPNISPPTWLPVNIKLSNYIVILDDATSIHSYLQSVFSRIPDVKYFKAIAEFKAWAKEHTHILETVTYFIDNQLDDHSEHGIDLIKSYKIMHTAYLTTNEYENQLIQEEATKFNIKIIPKPLLKFMLTTYSDLN
ncbi:MAG: HAMP domain-containing histidine kinase [Burkholderiales bacterium]|nr:HAMP domain-containing histidine kinase [Burkholderiales bacterium]